jgi:hypothetical protein
LTRPRIKGKLDLRGRRVLLLPVLLFALYAVLSYFVFPNAPGGLTLNPNGTTGFELMTLLLLEVVTMLAVRNSTLNRRIADLASQVGGQPKNQEEAPDSEPAPDEPEGVPDQVPTPIPLGRLGFSINQVGEGLDQIMATKVGRKPRVMLDPSTQQVLAKLEEALAPDIMAGYRISSIEVKIAPVKPKGRFGVNRTPKKAEPIAVAPTT